MKLFKKLILGMIFLVCPKGYSVVTSDVIWKTPNGCLIRVSGDAHYLSEKDGMVFEEIKYFLDQSSQSSKKLVVALESVCDGAESENFKFLADDPRLLVSLNKLALDNLILNNNVKFDLTSMRNDEFKKNIMNIFGNIYPILTVLSDQLIYSLSGMNSKEVQFKTFQKFFEMFSRDTLISILTMTFDFFNHANIEIFKKNFNKIIFDMDFFKKQNDKLFLNIISLTDQFDKVTSQLNELINVLDYCMHLSLDGYCDFKSFSENGLQLSFKQTMLQLKDKYLNLIHRLCEVIDSGDDGLGGMFIELENVDLTIKALNVFSNCNNIFIYCGEAHASNLNKLFEKLNYLKISYDAIFPDFNVLAEKINQDLAKQQEELKKTIANNTENAKTLTDDFVKNMATGRLTSIESLDAGLIGLNGLMFLELAK